MERIDNLNQENNKEKGENVVIHAIFVRHGEKEHDPDNPETELTLGGEWGSREFGQSRPKSDMAKPYSSKTLRTEKTAQHAVRQSPTKNKGNLRFREDLSFIYDEKGKFLKDVMKIKMSVLGDNYEVLNDQEKEKRLYEATTKQVDYYLNFGNQRPDPKTYSPVETAARIAKLIDKYITMSGKLKSGSNIDLINATHDFNLAAFLKEVIIREVDGKKVKGFKSTKEIGGPPNFNENFEITIDRKDGQDISIKMIFRGEEYEMDMRRVAELVIIAKKLEN